MRGLFFLLGIFGIVLLINLDLKAKPNPEPVFPILSVFELAEVEGLMANYSIHTNIIPPQPVDCPCNGTKEIKSGDGLIKIPCPCTNNGECKCKGNTGEPMAQVQLPNPFAKGNQFNTIKKKYILVYVGAEWCGPCVQVKKITFPRLLNEEWEFPNGKFKYSIGESVDNMIISLDSSSCKELLDFLEADDIDDIIPAIPAFLKINIQDKKIVNSKFGFMSAEEVHKYYNTK